LVVERDFTTEPTDSTADAELGQRLRQRRLERGLSLREVARRADVTASFLSQVETGQVAPSLSSLRRFCQAVGLSVVEAIEGAEPVRTSIVRANARPRLRTPDRAVDLELLCDSAGRPFDVVYLRLAPGGSTADELSSHDAHELLFVIQGKAQLEIGSRVESLSAGDAIYFSSNEPHRVVNPGKSDAVMISCIAGRF
jgi:transcriptional regulator with XRE-family HTH domain